MFRGSIEHGWRHRQRRLRLRRRGWRAGNSSGAFIPAAATAASPALAAASVSRLAGLWSRSGNGLGLLEHGFLLSTVQFFGGFCHGFFCNF